MGKNILREKCGKLKLDESNVVKEVTENVSLEYTASFLFLSK